LPEASQTTPSGVVFPSPSFQTGAVAAEVPAVVATWIAPVASTTNCPPMLSLAAAATYTVFGCQPQGPLFSHVTEPSSVVPPAVVFHVAGLVAAVVPAICATWIAPLPSMIICPREYAVDATQVD
jgi:hypothetical protein